jgi:hypothetical protein
MSAGRSRRDEEEFRRFASPLAPDDQLDADAYPSLSTLSPAFLYQFLPRPLAPMPAEYAYVPMPPRDANSSAVEMSGFLASWNWAWETAELRSQLLEDELPDTLAWLKNTEANVSLVPLIDGNRYAAYSTLYRLLPRRTLERFGLPLLRRALWPETLTRHETIAILPGDYEARLARAFAHHIWPLLHAGGRLTAFSGAEPIKLLAHNLDYWLPHADAVVQEHIKWNGRCDFDKDSPDQSARLSAIRLTVPEGFAVDRPYRGGPVWVGEEEAWEATQDLVNAADTTGRLRSLIDAVRSHRVEDDFSERWSYAREDFERKLHCKRRKVRVRFVELTETVAVHAPEAEVHANLSFEDFLALLNPKEREIVVCIRNGVTRVGDIARTLGYANHSPVSKALARIRRRAQRALDD